jgi:hypothetical protein
MALGPAKAEGSHIMTQWEYCELLWQPQEVTVTELRPDGDHQVRKFGSNDSPTVFARLGKEGWELTCCLCSPTGIHEYWYYFKRPVAS